MHPAHLGKGLEQGQVEPLEEGERLGAAGHLAGREAGHIGQQVCSQALEHLRLVEAEFAFGQSRPGGLPGASPPQAPASRSRSSVSVTNLSLKPSRGFRAHEPQCFCGSLLGQCLPWVGGHRI